MSRSRSQPAQMKILIAEDDVVERRVLRATVKKLGHEVVAAPDGLEAWERFDESPSRIVVSKRMMPRLDGLDLCRRIRQRKNLEYTWFILLTMFSNEEEYRQAMDAGVDDVLAKPLDGNELMFRLRAAERVIPLREMSLRLSRAKDDERRRIARDLHDSTGQKLAALSMTVGMLQDATRATDDKTEKMFASSLELIEQCAQEIRTLSYLLHPPLLDELGLGAALGDYVEGFSKRSGVRVTLDMPPALERLPEEIELALFRVVQECLANIHRHAAGSAAHIRFACDAGQVTLEVSDQSHGMSAKTLRGIEDGRGTTGVGIAGMQERLQILGGRLEIESGAQGTTVRAILPIADCEKGMARDSEP